MPVKIWIYRQDFYSNGTRLNVQLLMLHIFRNYQLFGEVIKLMQLLLVCPASVAIVERSFSDLRRLKTWI